jgi:hypothetical protein
MDDAERERHRRIAQRKVESLREAATNLESLLALQRDEDEKAAEAARVAMVASLPANDAKAPALPDEPPANTNKSR